MILTIFVLYCIYLCMEYSFGFSNFLEEISSLPISFFSFISLHCSLRKTFLSLLGILWDSAFRWCTFPFICLLLLFSAIYKASADNHFAFLHFFSLGMVLITTCLSVSQNSIHSSSGILSDITTWIYLWLPPYNHKWFDLGHTWMA